MKKHHLLVLCGALLVVAGIVLLISQPTAVQAQDEGEEPAPLFLQGYYDAWMNSPHADAEAEAFVHWDEDGEVPVECATCHSTTGYRDYLGVDGTDFGSVENPAPIGTVVNCDACHNPVAANLTMVEFPSGLQVENQGDATRCMVCHQGRASTVQVNAALENAGLMDDMNAVDPELGFINIHYYAAAASVYGSEVQGGYQFEGKSYQMRFEHVEGYDNCSDCHNPHTLEIKIDECDTCHLVDDVDELVEVRMSGSMIDYDGDGDIREGIAEEIETLQEMLYEAIQLYASNVAGTPIVYDSHSYPYFFIDGDGDGEPGEEEANYGNRYNSFTGHLLQAVYNYQVSLKDPGNYAHNAKYHIELLYDSIEVLNMQMDEGVDLSLAHRDDPGHFDATAEAFRHWDEDGEVAASCTKCHTATGLPFFLEHGVTIAMEPSNELACTTCHVDVSDEFEPYVVDEVEMPSGAVVTFGEEEPSNICLNCHQGRESSVSVTNAIMNAGVGPDEVSEDLNFCNPHYFAAGATLFGAEAQGAAQYEGKEYSGRFFHAEDMQTCTSCHDTHALENRVDFCTDCHEDVETAEDIMLIRQEANNVEAVDYDGDGDVTEPVAAEIETLHTDLMVQIQAYAADTLGEAILYVPASYPYWFIDTNGNGEVDDDEVSRDNRYNMWTPTLLRAAYNYQYVAKDPGAFAHNADYVLQALYDSLESLGGEDAVASYTRPPVQ
jgi:ferredoxin